MNTKSYSMIVCEIRTEGRRVKKLSRLQWENHNQGDGDKYRGRYWEIIEIF